MEAQPIARGRARLPGDRQEPVPDLDNSLRDLLLLRASELNPLRGVRLIDPEEHLTDEVGPNAVKRSPHGEALSGIGAGNFEARLQRHFPGVPLRLKEPFRLESNRFPSSLERSQLLLVTEIDC